MLPFRETTVTDEEWCIRQIQIRAILDSGDRHRPTKPLTHNRTIGGTLIPPTMLKLFLANKKFKLLCLAICQTRQFCYETRDIAQNKPQSKTQLIIVLKRGFLHTNLGGS